jgi:hypothetical protein
LEKKAGKESQPMFDSAFAEAMAGKQAQDKPFDKLKPSR